MSGGHRLWGGRFSGGSAAAFDRINSSLEVDRRMWAEDIAGSRAHAAMLAACGIISNDDGAAIAQGLDTIERELAEERFDFQPSDEDIHTAVERRLTELVGDAGRRLHTARSRNDQVITDTLLHLRAHATAQREDLRALAEALVAQAEAHLDTLLPGYTHSQRAQPVRLAHHLLAYVWMLNRDLIRLDAAIAAASSHSPLGSGALAGVGFPIDRDQTAAALGFAAPSPNSLDAVGSRDALIDYLHFAAQLGVHLSRLGAEIVAWAGEEVGFVTLDDSFTSGSSMLPQKKNPDAAELARAKAPRLIADLGGLLNTLSSLPLAYNKDLQEDKSYLFDALDTVDLLLAAMTGMIAGASFRVDRMRAAADDGFLPATDLADHLVRRGAPFRTAHEQVGALVRICLEQGIGLAEASDDQLRSAGLDPEDMPELSAEASVETKAVPGGTARSAVQQQLAAARAAVAAW